MSWLTLVSLLVQLALQISRYLERRQALQEGRAQALRELLEQANELIRNADVAAAAVSNDPDAILSDPYNDASGKRDKPDTKADGV